MKSLISEQEKLRIRSMHINEKISLLKEDDGKFFDLLPIPPSTASVEVASTPVDLLAGLPKAKTPEAYAFQDWLDANKVDWNRIEPTKNWKKTKGTKAYGMVGDRTKAAWAKFKDDYNKTLVK